VKLINMLFCVQWDRRVLLLGFPIAGLYQLFSYWISEHIGTSFCLVEPHLPTLLIISFFWGCLCLSVFSLLIYNSSTRSAMSNVVILTTFTFLLRLLWLTSIIRSLKLILLLICIVKVQATLPLIHEHLSKIKILRTFIHSQRRDEQTIPCSEIFVHNVSTSLRELISSHATFLEVSRRCRDEIDFAYTLSSVFTVGYALLEVFSKSDESDVSMFYIILLKHLLAFSLAALVLYQMYCLNSICDMRLNREMNGLVTDLSVDVYQVELIKLNVGGAGPYRSVLSIAQEWMAANTRFPSSASLVPGLSVVMSLSPVLIQIYGMIPKEMKEYLTNYLWKRIGKA
jgi:hypothetical protein